MNKNPKAFVLMPFDPEFSSIYEGLIKLALEDAGYDVARADSFLDQQNILRDIIRGIATAHLIVADLTTLNPNVLYELGLCHGLRIPTILLAQSMEEVLFDLRSYRIQLYSTRFDKVHRLKQALKEVAERHKLQEIMFGSPVTDFLPEGYASIRNVPEISAEQPAEKVPEEVEEKKGFLDFILKGTQAAEEMTHMMSVISEETVSISRKIEEHAARIQALAKKPGPGTAAQAHKIASIAARDMN